jgi:hypothetical protein
MKKKNIQNKRKEESAPIHMCIECGEELEDFVFNTNNTDESTRERFHNCQKIGKFKGEMCSRLFINDFQPEHLPDELENPAPPDED